MSSSSGAVLGSPLHAVKDPAAVGALPGTSPGQDLTQPVGLALKDLKPMSMPFVIELLLIHLEDLQVQFTSHHTSH